MVISSSADIARLVSLALVLRDLSSVLFFNIVHVNHHVAHKKRTLGVLFLAANNSTTIDRRHFTSGYARNPPIYRRSNIMAIP